MHKSIIVRSVIAALAILSSTVQHGIGRPCERGDFLLRDFSITGVGNVGHAAMHLTYLRLLHNVSWHGRLAHETWVGCPCHVCLQGFCKSLTLLKIR